MIYAISKDELHFNENGQAEGFGEDGGLLARLKGMPKKGTPEIAKKEFTYLELLVSADC